MKAFSKILDAMLTKQTTPTWTGPAAGPVVAQTAPTSLHGWNPGQLPGLHGWNPSDVVGLHGWNPR